MRVITGIARGRKLQTLPGLEVRPTSEAAKEAIFSILQNELENAMVLDLFAGSGQLGIEALSRGARQAIFVDQNRDAKEVVLQNLTHTGLIKQARVAQMDALSFLAHTQETFDIALLDPPYNKELIHQALPLLAPHMAPTGVIVCESDKREVLPEQAGGVSIYREYRYGKAKVTVYRRPEEE
mgnify:CR=1 FL=1